MILTLEGSCVRPGGGGRTEGKSYGSCTVPSVTSPFYTPEFTPHISHSVTSRHETVRVRPDTLKGAEGGVKGPREDYSRIHMKGDRVESGSGPPPDDPREEVSRRKGEEVEVRREESRVGIT